jgi:hypothetical protein
MNTAGMQPWEAWLFNDPIGQSVFALIRNTVYAGVGFGLFMSAIVILFWYLNSSLGITKAHVWPQIADNPDAVAHYFGLRQLGILIAGGLFLSAFVK